VLKWLKYQIDKALDEESSDRKGKVRCYPSTHYMDKTLAYNRARPFQEFNDGELYVEEEHAQGPSGEMGPPQQEQG